jgi:hypothetical protein
MMLLKGHSGKDFWKFYVTIPEIENIEEKSTGIGIFKRD